MKFVETMHMHTKLQFFGYFIYSK